MAVILFTLGTSGCTRDDPPPPAAPAPASYPAPAVLTGSFLVHDPTVVKAPDGTYLVAYTGNNIGLKTSRDLVDFAEAGPAFPDGAPWTTKYTDGSAALWAPDLSFHNGKYFMYYSASTFGSNHSAIFLATSTTGKQGSWQNQGLVLESAKSDNFNAIDPNLYVDSSGRWWLTFGSFWSGIQQVELKPGTGKPLSTTVRLVAGRGGGAIEAPILAQHGSYYYLWVSFDRCCQGAASTYRIMVGRSTSPEGPFVDRAGTPMATGGGTEVLAGHGSIHGPGHQAILTDGGSDLLVYHYYADNGNSLLGINKLEYDAAGWPTAR
ncbi:MAG TPA: arabinan endo-1,5-alpha-L-arabinosidase [Actinoplanes sp.]